MALSKPLKKVEVCDLYGIASRTFERLARRPKDPLPCRRIGRKVYCDVAELEAWFARQRPVVRPTRVTRRKSAGAR